MYVDSAPDKFLYMCTVTVHLKGINDSRDQSYNLGSETRLTEADVVRQVTQDVIDNSVNGVSGSYGQVAAVLNVVIDTLMIRNDL